MGWVVMKKRRKDKKGGKNKIKKTRGKRIRKKEGRKESERRK